MNMKLYGYLLLVAVLTACGVESSSVVVSASTTCVSDPLAPSGDDDAVAQCPPPTQAQIAQAAAANYALRYTNPAPTARAEGGCTQTANSTTCVLELLFGGGQVIIIQCTTQANGQTDCTGDVIEDAQVVARAVTPELQTCASVHVPADVSTTPALPPCAGATCRCWTDNDCAFADCPGDNCVGADKGDRKLGTCLSGQF